MGKSSKPRNVWAICAGVLVLLLAVLATAALNLYRDPKSGKITQISESDRFIHETHMYPFNLGRVISTFRKDKAHVSDEIEAEIKAAGLGPMVPILDEVDREEWQRSRAGGETKFRVFIAGFIKSSKAKVEAALRKCCGEPQSAKEVETALYLSFLTRPNQRQLMVTINPGRPDENGRAYFSLIMLPEGTPYAGASGLLSADRPPSANPARARLSAIRRRLDSLGSSVLSSHRCRNESQLERSVALS